MKLKKVKDFLTSKAGRQVLKVQKHSPTLLFVGGVAGVIGAAVLASRSTLKLDDVLVEAQEELKLVKTTEHVNYTEADRQRDLTVIYTRTALKLGKLYAPAVGLGVLSIFALTGSHVILTKRNTALAAAYTVLDRGFRQYQERVEAELGPDKARELRYGLEDREVYDDESGKIVTVRDKMKTGSVYARLFDETNPNWSKERNYNQFFLASQQQYCNDKLRAQGHLFLNEVHDMLGLDRTREGAVVGWIWNPTCEDPPQGDGYVDFGIFSGDRESGMRFARGEEGSIWLDFNVDGVIYNLI